MVIASLLFFAVFLGGDGRKVMADGTENKQPKTGTITFYTYKLRTYGDHFFNTASEPYFVSTSGILIYEYNGTSYLVKNDLIKDGKWSSYPVDVLGCDYSPGAETFCARQMPPTYDIYKHGYFFAINLVADDLVGYKYQGVGAVSGGYLGNYSIEKGNGSADNWYRSIWQMPILEDNKLRITYKTAPICMAGKNSYVSLSSYSGGKTNADGFWMYHRDNKKIYTCINENFTLGSNQVYVADEDLFLGENVKLTIPDGAVLCVKNGPFYVNGEIECSGTILVEDGGSILPYASEASGSRIVLKEGGAMIIRSGGRVYAGCPKGSLATAGTNGWLDMYAGSTIHNFGLLVAGQCNFKYGLATIETHKGGATYLGYAVDKKSSFLSGDYSKGEYYDMGLTKTNGQVYYGKDSNKTVIKAWEGARTTFANMKSDGGQTVKLYSYDKDGKCTVKNDFKPQ